MSVEKKKRGRPAKPPPSVTIDAPKEISLQELALSQLQVQKDIKRLTKLVLARPSTSTGGATCSAPLPESGGSSSTEAAGEFGSDPDYPPSSQPGPVRSVEATVSTPVHTRKNKAQLKKRKEVLTSSVDSSSCVEDSDSSGRETSLENKRRRARRAVSQLLDVAAPDKSSKRGKKNFIPGNFIKCGSKFQKVGHGEASLPEYLLALKAMAKSPECPTGWAVHLGKHEELLLIMATDWDWNLCRLWSEAIFVKIHDGTLPDGWNDLAAHKDVQRDLIVMRKKSVLTREVAAAKTEVFRKRTYTAPATVAKSDALPRTYGQESGRVQYDREKDGKPCYPWNWGRECGFPSSHGVEPDLKPHICAYCAYRAHKVLAHRELDCINKQRAATRAQPSSSAAKDF